MHSRFLHLCCMMVIGCSILMSCCRNTAVDPIATVPAIIYDTDMGSSTDDLFALEMLYRYHEQGRCRLLGIVVDRMGEDCAACADVMNTYFGHGDLPIALVRNGIENPSVWIDYKGLPGYTHADGSPMFRHSVEDYSALPDGWQLYRRLLAAEPDHSVRIVSVGFVTCLAQLLESPGDEYSPLSGVELVRQKVQCLYIQGGRFSVADEGDYNFAQGIDFAQRFFRLWPSEVDIVFSPMETGQMVEYTPEQVIADIDWTDIHPIKQVYMTCNCNTGQKMWDPMTVINAVEGDSLFILSERGTVTILPNAETPFTPSPTGNCRYQMPNDSAWAATMLSKIRTVNKMH
ncbi:MAG: nucleoside hydrolase [Bacteroidales bacterium]|nr:nucleoside hydrolase [Bacteroidales bacterium]